MKRLRKARGLVVVGLWSFFPVIMVQTDEQGGLAFSLGTMAGQYEVVTRSCAGKIISALPMPVQTTGVLVEFEPAEAPFRIAAQLGTSSVSGETSVPEGSSDFRGTYAGALVAFEGQRIGLGAGPLRGPGGHTHTSAYLRLGTREGGFFQFDAFAPSVIPGATGFIRGGIGFNQDGTSGFFGLSTVRSWDGSDWDNGGPFAEMNVSLGPSLDAHLGGSWFFAEKNSDWGAGIGLRYRRSR